VSQLPGVPSTAFVNDIKADLHDTNTVYVALDNHKYGDFKPYLYKSTNKGQSWVSLTKTIPENHLVWRLVQDHVSPNLLFIGTEFGLFFSVNGGKQWTALKGNVPTISFRDLAIQKRENDLVAASFGRGFYILDDYSALREASQKNLNTEAQLFPVRDAWWYIQQSHLSFEANKGSQGDSHFVAPNPDFGAVFTYYLKEAPELQKDSRKTREKNLKNQNIPFPGWKALEDEKLEQKPQLVFVIKNQAGEVIRNIFKEATSGVHRTAWDLRYPSPYPIGLGESEVLNDNEGPKGLLAPPGKYSVTLYLSNNGTIKQLDSPVNFNVKTLYKNTLEGSSIEITAAFWRSFEDVSRTSFKIDKSIIKAEKKSIALHKALMNSTANTEDALKELKAIRDKINTLKSDYYGNQAKSEIGEKNPPSVSDKMFTIYLSLERSTYGPTETNKTQMQIVKTMLTKAENELKTIESAMDKFETMLKASGAPYIDD